MSRIALLLVTPKAHILNKGVFTYLTSILEVDESGEEVADG